VWAIAIGTPGFVGAVVPMLSLVFVSAVPAVYTAGYLGTARRVAVTLAAQVVLLYSGVFVDHFGQLTSPKEPKRVNWLFV
jgi:uncharacterized membrane protein YdcZ (DUF606 family)